MPGLSGLSGPAGLRVGLDVGGTKTDAVALSASGDVVARARLATGMGPDAVVATILAAVAAVAGDETVASVGVGIPGRVDGRTVRHAVNLGVAELDLAGEVGAVLGVPVAVENDVNAAALGVAHLHGTGASTAYLNLGTGVAAGVVVDGMLWRGGRGTAGEVGHLSVDPAGPLCRCGQHGCIEALAGGGAVAARWGSASALPVVDLWHAADAGDPRAVALRVGVARGVAAAVRALVLTMDVDAVVLGGGLTGLGERLLDPVLADLRASAATSPFLASLRLPERVELLPAGSPAAALGAALVGSGDPLVPVGG